MFSFWVGIISLTLLGVIAGLILGFASRRFHVEQDPIVESIDALLPQSQCGQCGYPGCRPYAEAIANGEVINKCAPGGEQVMLKIAETLGIDPPPLGEDGVELETPVRKVAFIDESNCIGCTKCIQACPVDAIVGSTKALHTVITDACTGCDLCLPPCPTDCIEMIAIKSTTTNWKWDLNTISVKNIPVKNISVKNSAIENREERKKDG